jgi:hypothetical protein
MSTVRARVAIAFAALAACAALSACGGGGDDTAASSDAAATSTATTATAETGTDASGSPESRIAPDAEVTAGLTALKGVAAKVTAAPGAGAAAKDGLEAAWEPIEGTVKRNEPDLYLDVEDSFEMLTSGRASDVRRGRQRLDQAVDAYLARHPG